MASRHLSLPATGGARRAISRSRHDGFCLSAFLVGFASSEKLLVSFGTSGFSIKDVVDVVVVGRLIITMSFGH